MADAQKQWMFALERFVVFLRDVIDPAVYALDPAHNLNVRAHQCKEPVTPEAALKASFRPVKLGWQWGPRWSTAWFEIRGQVPASMVGQRVVLRFSTDTEALAYLPVKVNARGQAEAIVPRQGLDVNRDAVVISEKAKAGESVLVYVEAACNHMFGDRGLQWDPPEIHRRWNSSTPGLFEKCELATRDETVWQLRQVYAFTLDLAKQQAPDSARAGQLLAHLRRATNMLPDGHVRERAGAALKMLLGAVKGEHARAGGSATKCHAVGHAHIDTAWLWPLRETKRKCQRTFSTVLRNMERFPQYRFVCSQAQQYAWIEEQAPALFKQIKKRVAEGRWEPGGSMWIEPDCTCPSGEALLRQILVADRYWRSRFGDQRGAQRFLYLPDTFGFPASLPTIMRAAGLDTFITNKLHWNSHNTFPHTTFVWRGLDGSAVVAHQTPGMDYNATNTPKELIRGEKTHKNKDLLRAEDGGPARWLQPYGYGDGGGGPTDWSILFAQLAESCDGLPEVEHSSVTSFCDDLHADVAKAKVVDPSSVPEHRGELYLELHRGTYTTHAKMKHANKECQELLRQAEILSFAGPKRLSRTEEKAIKVQLDTAWKLVLLNQFHDILPGSSITWVYDDAAKDYERVRSIARGIIDAGERRWAAHVLKHAGEVRADAAVVLNPASWPAQPVLEARKGQPRLAAEVLDPLSVSVVTLEKSDDEHAAVTVRGRVLQNEHIRAEFDEAGRIVSFKSLQGKHSDVCEVHAAPGEGRGAAERTALNQLALYEDRPRLWDAWDIDEEYAQKGELVSSSAEMSVVHAGGVRGAIRFSRSLGARSRIAQTFVLDAASEVVRVETEVDWQEEHRMLRVLFPTGVRASHACVGTQFGWVDRSMHRNTSIERAMFETPAHGFITLWDQTRSLGILTGSKYGVSHENSTLGLTLLRSTRYPDAKADVGVHRFSYALGPNLGHACVADADRFDRPARIIGAAAGAVSGKKSTPGSTNAAAPEVPHHWSPLSVRDGVFSAGQIEAMKLAEDGDALIVRIVDHDGVTNDAELVWGFAVQGVTRVDALERPLSPQATRSHARVRHDAKRNTTHVTIHPFEIVTLRVERSG